MTIAWALTEGAAGMRNQAVGLIEAMGLDAVVKDVPVRAPWDWLPGRLWPVPLHAPRDRPMLAPPWPDLVVSCGNVGAPLAAAIRRATNGATRAVHVTHPKMGPAAFDLVVAPAHDGLAGPNVIVTRTQLHRVTPARLAEARAAWAPRFAHLRRPLVGVLVGGRNGRHRLDATVAKALAHQLLALEAGLIVTLSRRTPADAADRFRARLGDAVWDGAGENPYFGILACADALVVTEDSVAMLSEAAATAAPLLIARLPGRSRRLAAFRDGLVAAGRARLFDGTLPTWPVTPLDDTPAAAAEVSRRLGLAGRHQGG
jgi:hypothetical protein